jgi:hypothetical protein
VILSLVGWGANPNIPFIREHKLAINTSRVLIFLPCTMGCWGWHPNLLAID